MVEHITGSESSDSYSMNRYFEMGSGSHSSRYGNTSSMERGRHANSWKRDSFDIGSNSTVLSHENGYHSPRRDAFGFGRDFSRKEFYGGPVSMSVTPSLKGGMPEHPQILDDFSNPRGSRWNVGGHNDRYYGSSDLDAEFIENDKFGDSGWGQSGSHGSPHALYGDRLLQNSEVDGFSSFGRARHSLRQPRVLPPPSVSSIPKMTLRAASEIPGSSVFLEKSRYQTAGENAEEIIQVEYENRYHDRLQPTVTRTSQEITISAEQRDENNTPWCDSQSSLSVLSPPCSPTHLSHDDLDESGNFPALPSYADGKQLALSDNEHLVSASEAGKTKITTASGSVSPGEDDEWVIENNKEMCEQEIYDEEENGYHQENGVHEGDNVNDLSQEFEDLHPDVANVTCEMNQLVLGFNDGVEVRVPRTDEFGRSSETAENETQIATVGSESGPLVALASNGEHGHHSENTSSHAMDDRSSNIDTETERALEDLTLQPVTSSSYFLDRLETSGYSGMPAQEPVSSAFDLLQPATSALSILPSHSDVPSQAEVPLKLQFGLFSGPSLIPSPVPPIQIGSIQMPLHLHPPLGLSLTQVHSSQPPYFEFGQLKYTSCISQGILPLAPQSMSFVQSDTPTQYSLNQKLGSSLHSQMNHNNPSYSNSSNDKMPSVLSNNNVGLLGKPLDLSQEKSNCNEPKAFLDYSKGDILSSQSQAECSMCGDNKNSCESVSQVEHQGDPDVLKTNNPSVSNREPHGPLAKPVSSPYLSEEKSGSGPKSPGSLFGSRGKRYVYTVRSATSRPFPRIKTSHTDSGGFQRRQHRNNRQTEFRLVENDRKTEGMDSSIYVEEDDKSNFKDRVSRISVRNGAKRNHFLNKLTRMVIDSQSKASGASSSQEVHSEGKLGKTSLNKSKNLTSSVDNLHSGEGSLKKNSRSEEDVDAPLQTGVVRIFNQPGMEAPSDEDDFIEVRSKRQMLNDRREQREKEIKAKSGMIKGPRKSHYFSQRNGVASVPDRVVASQVKVASTSVPSDPVIIDGTGFANGEQSIVFSTNIASQSLHPIGTPAVNANANKRSHMKSVQTSSVSVISTCTTELVPGSFENRNVVVRGVPTALSSLEHAHMNQKVMNLTQTQLDEAIKPGRFDTHVASIADHAGIVLEPAKQTASVIIQDKLFPSSARSLNSMLAGERIQFGAVTSPVILPAFSRVVTNGIGPPGSGSCRPDVSIDRNLPATGNNCTRIFEKEKHTDEFVVHLEDPEAEVEAEAAACAVAVAAFSSDEVVGNGLGTCSVSADTKTFRGADVSVITSRGNREVTSQTSGEESLSVTLPVDLSVETPSLSSWPHLPSPQSSSTPLLSHIPGPPPSHFPFFEVNPMLGGPIFAFGPHDESIGTQSQPQRSTTLGSNPLAAWPQCHSGMDSFYGPPAGFTGPFTSPPGGIPSVQGPPHMYFYNHFTPVGQFGQQVLSFMGTTYIPSGKQPDWKHNPVSTAVDVSSEFDISNLNVVPGQRKPPNIPAPIQHLAPGSPLMPMASPLAMFDMSPFQSSANLPLQARWPRVPAPTLHSVPLSLPLHPHRVDGGISPPFNHSHSLAPSDGSQSLTLPADYPAQFADGLGLVGTPSDTSLCVQMSQPSSYSSCSGNNSRGHGAKNSSSVQHSLHPVKNADQRGGGASSQKLSSGSEWHRNKGFQGRNQVLGAEKNFTSTSTSISTSTSTSTSTSKIKQIYVAKPPTTSGAATLG